MKWFKSILRILTILFVIGLIAFLGGWIYLPIFLQENIVPLVIEKYQLKDYELNIQYIGFNKTSFGPITIGSKIAAEEIRVENIEVRYNFINVLMAYMKNCPLPVDKINVSGVNVGVTLDSKGKVSLKTTEWDHLRDAFIKVTKGDDVQVLDSTKNFKGVKIGGILVRNANIFLEYEGARYSIKCDCMMSDSERDILRQPEIAGRLFTEEHKIGFRMRLLKDNVYTLTFNTEVDLKQLPRIATPTMNVDFSGEAKFNGAFAFKIEDHDLSYFKVDIHGEVDQFGSTLFLNGKRSMRIKNKKKDPIKIDFSMNDSCFSLGVFPVNFTYPLGAMFALNFDGTLTEKGIALSMQNKMDISSAFKIPSMRKIKSDSPFELTMLHHINFDYNLNGDVKTEIQLNVPAPIVYGQTRIVLPEPFNVNVVCKIDKMMPCAQMKFELDSLKIIQDKMAQIQCDKISGDAFYTPYSDSMVNLRVDFGQGKIVSDYDVDVAFNATKLALTLDSLMRVAGDFESFLPTITHPIGHADSTRILIPFTYPYQSITDSGYISVDSIYYQNDYVASSLIGLKQEGVGVCIDGRLSSDWVKGLSPQLNAKVGYFTNENLKTEQFGILSQFEIPQWTIPDSFGLGHFSNSLSGFELTGTISGRGEYGLGFVNINPHFQLDLENMGVNNEEMGLFVKGLTAQLSAEKGRVNWRTLSGQRISVKELNIKAIKISNILVSFNFEESGNLQIEGIDLNWCGGKVSSLSTQLSRKSKVYNIKLYCNDLYLRELLQQLSPATIAQMTGDARLSGLLPIRIDGNKLILEPGYLHTVPGIPGRFNLETTDQMMQGVDKESAAYSQVDLAREAIKSFEYQWIKLDIGMQVDPETKQPSHYKISLNVLGRPVAPLPFKYDLATGNFVRYTPEVGDLTGIKQDIDLTVNINSDIKVLDLGFNFKKMMKSFEKILSRVLPKRSLQDLPNRSRSTKKEI